MKFGRKPASLAQGNGLAQAISQQHPIGQAGQGIVVGHVLKLLLMLLERGDVRQQGHIMAGRVLGADGTRLIKAVASRCT